MFQNPRSFCEVDLLRAKFHIHAVSSLFIKITSKSVDVRLDATTAILKLAVYI